MFIYSLFNCNPKVYLKNRLIVKGHWHRDDDCISIYSNDGVPTCHIYTDRDVKADVMFDKILNIVIKSDQSHVNDILKKSFPS